MHRFFREVEDIVNRRKILSKYKNLEVVALPHVGPILEIKLGPFPYNAAESVYEMLPENFVEVITPQGKVIMSRTIGIDDKEFTLDQINKYLNEGYTITVKNEEDQTKSTFVKKYRGDKSNIEQNGTQTVFFEGRMGASERIRQLYNAIAFELDRYEQWHSIEEKQFLLRANRALNKYFVDDLSQEILIYI